MNTSLANLLKEGAQALGISLHEQQSTCLLDFLRLLEKWSSTYNLTAIRDPHAMLVQHLLDSLALVPWLLAAHGPHAKLLDTGTGGGLPGIPLAVALPEYQITLNDVVQKKVAFLTQAKSLLSLSNVSIAAGRIETLQVGAAIHQPFDCIVSRAFASLSDFVAVAHHLLAPGGSMWAMKGTLPEAEMELLPNQIHIQQIIPLEVPYLEAQRHLIQMTILPTNKNPESL